MLSRRALQAQQPTGADLVAVPAELAALTDLQTGVLTRRQLAEAGFGLHEIEGAVRARRWRAFGRHVVVLQNAPLTARQREWVAVLLPGKPAALRRSLGSVFGRAARLRTGASARHRRARDGGTGTVLGEAARVTALFRA